MYTGLPERYYTGKMIQKLVLQKKEIRNYRTSSFFDLPRHSYVFGCFESSFRVMLVSSIIFSVFVKNWIQFFVNYFCLLLKKITLVISPLSIKVKRKVQAIFCKVFCCYIYFSFIPSAYVLLVYFFSKLFLRSDHVIYIYYSKCTMVLLSFYKHLGLILL